MTHCLYCRRYDGLVLDSDHTGYLANPFPVLVTQLDAEAQLRALGGQYHDTAIWIRTVENLAARWRHDLARAMRDEGQSWADVGDVLGTSREAAWQRFKDCGPTPETAAEAS